MKFNMKSLLKNKYVLYIVFFFAVTNFFGYVLLKNYDAVIFMVLVGLVTSYFSKKMIVILVTAIACTTLLTAMSTVKEAMTTKAPTTSAPGNENDSDEENNEDSDEDSDDDNNEDSDEENNEDSDEDSDDDSDEPKVPEPFSTKKSKKKKQKALDLSNKIGIKSIEALEPMMKQAEGMLNLLDKTNAIKRMEGLVTKIDKLR